MTYAIFFLHFHNIYSYQTLIYLYDILKCHLLLISILIGIQTPFIWASTVLGLGAFHGLSNLSDLYWSHLCLTLLILLDPEL